MKNPHEGILRYFKAQFPAWVQAKPMGMHGYFESDLDRLSEQGYLDKEEHLERISTEEPRLVCKHSYRLSIKGFSELVDLRTKKWFRSSVIISVVALALSILSLLVALLLI